MKKAVKAVSILSVMLVAAAASASAFAWHRGGGGHVRFGLYVGAPLFAPWYYPPSYGYYPPYYPPAVISVPSSPPAYIEQGAGSQSAPAPAAQSYWYYCADSKTYYPYVKECPAGWMRVVPQPPPG